MTFESAVHETMHLNSNLTFLNQFGYNYNEAVTEYFTLKVFGVSTGKGHKDKLFLANGLMSAAEHFTMRRPPRITSGARFAITYPWYRRVPVGYDHAEKYVASAYFRDGAYDLLFQIKLAFSGASGKSADARFHAWQGISTSTRNAPDLAVADQLLRDAVSHPGGSRSGAGSGSGGGSASAGSGSKP